MEFSAKQIAEVIDGEVVGNEHITVQTFAKIEEGTTGAISFLANPKYTNYIYETKSSIVLVNKDFEPEHPISATLIKVDNAYESVAKLLNIYQANQPVKNGIDPLAHIAATATIGKDVYIAPFAYIGEHVTIGDHCAIHSHVSINDNVTIGSWTTLYPQTTIYHDCQIGNHCILHAGSVVGSDGFGFAPTSNGYDKIPQIGIVIIEDDVEIGANTCIDRSTMGATRIKKGVKLDNLVQIAHNVEIGENTVMCSQVGIAGSTKVGEWCMLGGQVGVAGHIKLGDKLQIGAQSGIAGNIKSNSKLMGSPAIDYSTFARSTVLFKNFPEIYKSLNEMKKEITELKKLLKK